MAKKKIVLFPGVGFHKDLTQYDKFLEKFRSEFGCDTEVFNWQHYWNVPREKLSFNSIRSLFCEIILDFQQVVKYATTMQVPPADCYIGHSAGSILALCQKDKPCVIFGSPAILVENIQDREMYGNMVRSVRPILNIVNTSDILAYPVYWGNVENYFIKPLALNPFKLFLSHTSYWNNNDVVEKIIKTISKWGILGAL